MGMMAISVADSKLVKHLKSGGQADDDVGLGLVRAIVGNTLENHSAGLAARHAGLTSTHLQQIYIAATKSLMPEPVIRHGKAIIVTSLVFQDFERFGGFIQIITNGGTLDPEVSMHEIVANAIATMHDLRDKARAEGKGTSLSEASAGCAFLMIGALALGVLAASTLARDHLLVTETRPTSEFLDDPGS